jgi:hypothetical protein
MKRFSVFLLALFVLCSVALVGCPGKSSPTSPTGTGSAALTPTGTPTQCVNGLGTPCTSTSTPTITETPACSSPFTFGKNTISGSSSEFSSGNALASRFNLSTGGKVIALHAYIPGANGGNIRMALYSDSSSQPGTLISVSGSQPAVTGWNFVNIPDTGVLGSGYYWIALATDNNSNGVTLSFDHTTTGAGEFGSMSYATFATTFPAGSTNDYNFSYYADYCVSAGSPTPVPTGTFTPTATSSPTNSPTLTQTASCSTGYSFGRNYTPSGSVSLGLNDGTEFSRFTLPVAGVVSGLHAYILAPNGDSFAMGIYSNNGSAPGTLISASGSQVAVSGWNNFSIPGTALLPAGTYWIAAGTNSPTNSLFFALNDYTLNADSTDGYVEGFTVIPATYSGGSGPNQQSYYFYADYCVPGSSPTPINSPTRTFTTTATPTNTPTSTQTASCSNSFSFGRNYVAGHTQEIDDGSIASRFTLPVPGIVSMLHAYAVSTTGYTIKMGLYSNTGSGPGTIISESGSQASVVGWNDLAIPGTALLPAGTYWIALGSSNVSGGPVFAANTYLDNSDATDGYIAGFTVLPSPYNGTAPSTDSQFSLSFYADYCVPGTSPTPVNSPTRTFTTTSTPTNTPTVTQTPVCSSPTTFGNPTIGVGANSYSDFNLPNVLVSYYPLTVSGQIIRLHVNVKSVPTPGTNLAMALYSNSGSAPGTLISQSNEQPAVAGLNTFDIPGTATLTAPATFWIALTSNTFNSNINLYYDTSDATNGYIGSSSSTFPAAFSGSGPEGWTFAFSADKCP